MSLDKHCLAFVHIPKTAGTTFKTQLRRQYGWDRVLDLQPDNPISNFETLAQMEPHRRGKIRVYAGHWGMEQEPNLPQQTEFLTFMRDPVERVISLYQHIWRDTSHRDHRTLRDGNLTLRDFAEAGISSETDNGQVRLLAGADPEEPCSDDMVRRAQENLERFVAVGFTERFDESLVLMRRRLGWRWPVYVPENQKPRSVRLGTVTPECRAVVTEINVYGQRLYDWAWERFQVETRGPGAQADLKKLRLFNRLYRLYHSARYHRTLLGAVAPAACAVRLGAAVTSPMGV